MVTLRQPTQRFVAFRPSHRRFGSVPAGALAGRLTASCWPSLLRSYLSDCRPPPARAAFCLLATARRKLLAKPNRRRVVSRPQDGAPRWRTGQRYAYAQPVCRLPCESSDGTHATLPCCLAVHPCRPRAATSAGVHRNGVVAGLDVLLGEAGRYYRPGRHSGSCNH